MISNNAKSAIYGGGRVVRGSARRAGALATPIGLTTTFEILGALFAAVALVAAALAFRTRPEPATSPTCTATRARQTAVLDFTYANNDKELEMVAGMSRDESVSRLVRAGELWMSGENPEEIRAAFSPEFTFHAPGVEVDYDGLAAYFQSLRDAFDNRKITRGIVVVEENYVACQTTIEGDFVREFTQSPVGSLPPNGQHVVFELTNIFRYDDEGRIEDEYVQTDNRSVLQQLGAEND
jgi:predicted ester cyclase